MHSPTVNIYPRGNTDTGLQVYDCQLRDVHGSRYLIIQTTNIEHIINN